MAFRAALVAFGENAAAAPFLGHQFTEIVLREPNTTTDASNPVAVAAVSRDKIIEATDGRDVATNLRKLSQIVLQVDFVDTATKAAIERLYHDGRELYFCPNVGPATRWSFPFQRGLDDFAGRKTLADTRAQKAYYWNDAEKVFRSWAANEPAIDFGGAWTRYLRAQEGQANKASYPHPTSTGHGWTVAFGSAALTYSEDIESPVLEQRTIANQRGVLMVHAAQGGVAAIIRHNSAATLSTTNAVVASLCIAWQGEILVYLQSTASGTIVASTGALTGDGTFQLIKLGGANAPAANQYTVQVAFLNTTAKKQAAIIGPTFIANDFVAAAIPDVEDWNAGAAASDVIAASDSVDNALLDFTFSCFLRWSAYETGIVLMGSGSPFQIYKTAYDAIQVVTQGATSPVTFSNVQAALGVADGWAVGDWIHFVVRGSAAGGIALFVNGRAHSSNGSELWEPGDLDSTLRFGWFLPGSGISHARMDAVAWTDAEIVDHYQTYFERGRGVVEPMFGKVLTIDDLSFTPRAGAGLVQWVGRIVLSELGPREEFAPLQRQEGDV